MKKLESTPGGKQAEPAATKEVKTPAPSKSAKEPEPEPVKAEPAPAEASPVEPVRRSHANAVEAQREPVAAPRSQDANPEANKGVTITTEKGVPVAHPGSTLR